MKKIFKVAAILLFACISMGTYAQTAVKLGHVNSQTIIESLPEKDAIQKELMTFNQTLRDQIQSMNYEYQTKVQDYQNNQATMSDLVRQTKEKEITDLAQRIQEFGANADQQANNKQIELFNPLLKKVEKAIKDVGTENGYTYIFDVAQGIVVFYEKGDDLNAAVLAKLGVKK